MYRANQDLDEMQTLLNAAILRSEANWLFGSIDLTLDKKGLKAAKELKDILDLTVAEMEQMDLPEHISVIKPKTVKNPFFEG